MKNCLDFYCAKDISMTLIIQLNRKKAIFQDKDNLFTSISWFSVERILFISEILSIDLVEHNIVFKLRRER